MKVFVLLLFIPVFIYGGSHKSNNIFQQNNQKITLMNKSFQHVDSLENKKIEEKSVFMATLYSAILPGAGEYYAESYWKAALFAGLEIAGWTVHFIYDSKGNRQDERSRAFADQHWDEHKYWSKVYYDAYEDGLIDSIDPTVFNTSTNRLIRYDREFINSLRELEKKIDGYTHQLPRTKTQQYYEMIYKYLGQFGNGWDDADFYGEYSGYEDKLTPRVIEYRDMYNLTEDFFDIARGAANAMLLNHVISAIDAALTTRSYNKSLKINLSVNNENYLGEPIRMYGIYFTW